MTVDLVSTHALLVPHHLTMPPFAPATLRWSLSGLAFWTHAEHRTTSVGENISQRGDRTDAGNDLLQSTEGDKPHTGGTVNSLPADDFDGEGQNYDVGTVPFAIGTDSLLMAFSVQPVSSDSFAYLFSTRGNAGNGFGIISRSADRFEGFVNDGTINLLAVGTTAIFAAAHVVLFVYNALTGNVRLYVDGGTVEQSVTNADIIGNTLTSSLTGIMGDRPESTTRRYEGTVRQGVVYFNSTPYTLAEINIVGNSLADDANLTWATVTA